jgi:hypothetical protein
VWELLYLSSFWALIFLREKRPNTGAGCEIELHAARSP